MEGMKGGEGMMCKCTHHNFMPVLVILFGLLFLGGNMGWWGMGVVDVAWPVLVILAGVMKWGQRKCSCC